MKKLLCVYFIFNCTSINSQALCKAVLFDSITKQPVPFATLKVLNKQEGTYSDSEGRFELSLNMADTVLITSIGYITKRTLLNNADTIFLQPFVKELPTVTTRNRKSTGIEIYGIRNTTTDLSWSASGRGEEFAQRIELPSENETTAYKLKRVFLKARHFNDDVPVLLHVYSVGNNGLPDKELLQNKYLITKKNFKGNYITINLEQENLLLFDKNIFISFEWLGKTSSTSSSKKTVLEMTKSMEDVLTYSRTLVHPNFSWFPLLSVKNGKKEAVNTQFSVEVEKFE